MLVSARWAAVLVSLLVCTGAQAQSDRDSLAALRPMTDKTYHGVPTNPGARAEELSRWELILGGQVLRITHAEGDGSFGGETLVYWDAEKNGLVSVYVSTDGYRSEGTFELRADGWTAVQQVKGNPEITERRWTGTFGEDGTIVAEVEELSRDQWVLSAHVIYRPIEGL